MFPLMKGVGSCAEKKRPAHGGLRERKICGSRIEDTTYDPSGKNRRIIGTDEGNT